MSSSNTSDEVFQYTGSETVPKDVTAVNFDCSVVGIEDIAYDQPSAFQHCVELKELVLNNGLQTIGLRAFAHCKSLERIVLPSTVTEIRFGAFEYCRSLKEVVLNEGLETIGRMTFAYCSSLQSITLPSSVNEIEPYSFQSCINLREVLLSDGLKEISTQAFYECRKLRSITLPSSLVEIGYSAFQNCSNLRDVVYNGALPTIKNDLDGHNTFYSCPSLERITFPNLSSRLEYIIQAGQLNVQNKIQQYVNRGVIEWRRRRGTIYVTPAEVTRSRNRRGDSLGLGWDLVQQHVRHIVKWVEYYEMKEATTIFELALWKTEMDQVEDDAYAHDRKKAKIDQAGDTDRRDDRDSFRVDVPGPVKDAILQYLR